MSGHKSDGRGAAHRWSSSEGSDARIKSGQGEIGCALPGLGRIAPGNHAVLLCQDIAGHKHDALVPIMFCAVQTIVLANDHGDILHSGELDGYDAPSARNNLAMVHEI